MAKNLIWTILKVIFSVFRFFLHPHISDIQIVVSRPNIVTSLQTIHQWKAYLISFRIICNSQCRKIDTYDWFCGPGSHITNYTKLSHYF